MRSFRVAVPLLILAGTLGCQSTPYEKAYGTYARGYSDKKLSEDIFYVQFVATPFTSAETLDNYLYHRAAELTVRHGFHYFTILRDPRPSMQCRTVYKTQADRTAMIDKREREFPTMGTMHMTIQCFTAPEQAAGEDLIDAQTYLPEGHNPRRAKSITPGSDRRPACVLPQ